ncbi:MAG: preprotein translocase subunit YajC [bacterium]
MIASFIIMQAEQGGNPIWAFMPFILIFLIIYFLMIRPQSKKQKETKRMISSLDKGDRIVTIGGIYGTIVGIKEKEKEATLLVKIADNVKVELARSSVARKLEKAAAK